MKQIPIVLASASPRRRELLSLITKDFEVAVSQAEEAATVPEQLPLEQLPGFFAQVKAEDIAAACPEKLVIGSDTGVLVEDQEGRLQMLGKPADQEDARRMLKQLSGRKHLVSTGCCLCYGGQSHVFVEIAEVEFYELTDEEIDAYIATGEPMDKAGSHIRNTEKPKYYWEGKAGGYGIQDPFGARYIKEIIGNYYTVVGLPVSRLLQELKKLGIEL